MTEPTNANDLRKQAQELLAQAEQADNEAMLNPLHKPGLDELTKVKMAIDVVMGRIESQMQISGNYIMLDSVRKEFSEVRKALGLPDPYSAEMAALPKHPNSLPPHVKG